MVDAGYKLTQKTETAYISLVKLYLNADPGSFVQIQCVVEFADCVWHTADCFRDLGENGGNFKVLVSWKGFTSSGNTWWPFNDMIKHVSAEAGDFFRRKVDC